MGCFNSKKINTTENTTELEILKEKYKNDTYEYIHLANYYYVNNNLNSCIKVLLSALFEFTNVRNELGIKDVMIYLMVLRKKLTYYKEDKYIRSYFINQLVEHNKIMNNKHITKFIQEIPINYIDTYLIKKTKY